MFVFSKQNDVADFKMNVATPLDEYLYVNSFVTPSQDCKLLNLKI